MLKALGIDDRTEAVYLEMLRSPTAGVKDLAAAIGTSEKDVRSCLDRLAQLSLLHAAEDDGAVPVSPEVGLSSLIAREQAKTAQRANDIEQSRLAVAQFLSSHARLRSQSVDHGVEHLVGIESIRRRLAELAETCKREAVSFMPGGAQSKESLEASKPLDEAAIARGVRIRTVYLDSIRNDAPTSEYANWLIRFGSEVRTAPTLPLRMLIVDRECALVPVNSAESGQGALLLSGEGIVSALHELFKSIWRQATPLGSQAARDGTGLTAQERHLLALWSAGHTDASAGRQLGISVRTVRRIGANLMEQLGARSRFQAGGLAIEKGWITADDLAP